MIDRNIQNSNNVGDGSDDFYNYDADIDNEDGDDKDNDNGDTNDNDAADDNDDDDRDADGVGYDDDK